MKKLLLSVLFVLLFSVQAFAEHDYNLWKNGIEHSKSPTSLTDAVDGSGFIATAVISGVTTNSAWKMSLYDAYLDLYERLHEGEIPTPKSTTTESEALVNVVDGIRIVNITKDRLEVRHNSAWQSVAGIGMMSPVAFGEMEQVLEAGFTIGSIWIAAVQDMVDANGNITFVSDDTNGDHLLVGSDGGGTYRVEFLSVITTSTGNPVTVTIQKNGVDLPKLKTTGNTSTTDSKHLEDWEDMTLVAGDKLTLVHTISSGVITATSVKLELERID